MGERAPPSRQESFFSQMEKTEKELEEVEGEIQQAKSQARRPIEAEAEEQRLRAVGVDKVTTNADQTTSNSRESELRRVRLPWAVGLDGAVADRNRSSQEVKRRKAAKRESAATQDYEPYSVNDHMNVQMDVVSWSQEQRVQRLCQPSGVTDHVVKLGSATTTSVRASFMRQRDHTRSIFAWTATMIAA